MQIGWFIGATLLCRWGEAEDPSPSLLCYFFRGRSREVVYTSRGIMRCFYKVSVYLNPLYLAPLLPLGALEDSRLSDNISYYFRPKRSSHFTHDLPRHSNSPTHPPSQQSPWTFLIYVLLPTFTRPAILKISKPPQIFVKDSIMKITRGRWVETLPITQRVWWNPKVAEEVFRSKSLYWNSFFRSYGKIWENIVEERSRWCNAGNCSKSFFLFFLFDSCCFSSILFCFTLKRKKRTIFCIHLLHNFSQRSQGNNQSLR